MDWQAALPFAILLLLGNAFFVGAEFSMVSVRRSAIEPEAAKGSKRAIITLRALENISFLMAGAQLGVTLCSLALGAVAEPAIAHLLEGPFEHAHIDGVLAHPIAFVLALFITVFAHVVIVEMVPKNMALAKPERSAIILTPILVKIVDFLNPLVTLLNFLANKIVLRFNIEPQTEVGSTYTRDEMADLVKESRKEGFISEDNEQLLSGALSFDERTVRQVVLPVDQMITISPKTSYSDLEKIAVKTGYSRFPVQSRRKQITGYVHIKDAMTSGIARTKKIQPSQIRPIITVHANQSIRMTLKLMQRSGAHMALVSNGKKVLGIVTLEDVLEELIGEMSTQTKTSVNK